jgi:Second Messenger Oligonucleotide or Dinucleotide Synthetase domain
MAETAEEAFKVLVSWLAPRESELVQAAGHRDQIHARLRRKFGVAGMYEGGSLHHGTGVHQVSGADYFVWFTTPRPESSARTLVAVQKSLQKLYPAADVRVTRPGVLVEFPGAAQRIGVIPAYSAGRTVGEHPRFKVPGFCDNWTSASPSAQREWLEACNNAPGALGRAKGLTRLVRAWKHYRDVPVSSYYLEVRAASLMAERSSLTYAHDLRNFFATLLWDGLAPIEDPAGIAGTIPATWPDRREEALSKVANAAGWAEHALGHQRVGLMGDAFSRWNLIFDGRFPSYYRAA